MSSQAVLVEGTTVLVTGANSGFDTTFQVNHLGPFLLTNLLLDQLVASAPARIVNVASAAHRFASLDLDGVPPSRGGNMRAYARTKLYNVLFTRELARRLAGSGVTANCLHPETVRTRLGRDGDMTGLFGLGARVTAPLFLSAARGARTSIYLACSPDVEGRSGEYFTRSRSYRPSKRARDDEAARRLWGLSEELVGL